MKLKFLFVFVLFGVKSFSQERDLHFFIDKAQANSPLLADLSNQIKSNAIDSLLNRAAYKPQFAANLNASYAPVSNGFGYDTTLSNGQTVSALVSFNQKIVGGKRVNMQAETYRLLGNALKVNKKIAVKDVNKLITAQYITASGNAEQIVYNQKMTTLLREEAEILKKLTRNSIYKQADYLIFFATLKQQELQLLQLKQQYQNDLAMLNYLSGETDTTMVALKNPDIVLQPISTKEKSIFLKQYESDSLKIVNQNKLIDTAYKPSVSLLADTGYLSSLTYQAEKNFGFSIGLGVSVPIYDGNQRILQHQKNEMALATTSAYKTNYNKQYRQQILLLNLKLKQTTETTNQLQSQLQIAETLIEADKKLLISGDAQITDFIIAIGNLITINNAISQNKIDKFQIINEMNYWNSNN